MTLIDIGLFVAGFVNWTISTLSAVGRPNRLLGRRDCRSG